MEGAGAGASSFSAGNQLGDATVVCSFLLLLRILLLFCWFVRMRAKWIVSVGLGPVSSCQLQSAPSLHMERLASRWSRAGSPCTGVSHTGSHGQLRAAKVSVGSHLGLVFPRKPALASAPLFLV